MAVTLSGKDVAAALTAQIKEEAAKLQSTGTAPKLAILRVGEREDDLSYERGALKRAETCGVAV
mgnify:FL=1